MDEREFSVGSVQKIIIKRKKFEKRFVIINWHLLGLHSVEQDSFKLLLIVVVF